MLSYGTISRRYNQGLDSIVRLVNKLETEIEDLRVLHTSKPQRTITRLSKKVKRLENTLKDKSAQLLESEQLNSQLQSRIRELEKSIESDTAVSIEKDSHNSSMPPSLDRPWKKPKRTRSLRKKSVLKVGGQAGHKGSTLHQVSSPNRVIIHSVKDCSHCNLSLSSIKPSSFQKRQIFEIENGNLSVFEHQIEVKHCPDCQKASKAKFPVSIKAPVQYGSSVLSILVYLHTYQLIPVARTVEIMRDLFNCPVSQATVQRAVRFCSDKLIRCEQRIKAAIRDSSVIGVDETGIRINGTNAWVHVARTENLTHLATHTHRGKAAFQAIGIINKFKGTMVRDGWLSYQWLTQCEHSLCNAHLLRDLIYISEAEPKHKKWTTDLASLLMEIKAAIDEAHSQSKSKLQNSIQANFLKRYDKIVAFAKKAIRGSPKIKTTGVTAYKLCERLSRNKPEILKFMYDLSVPFDNNGSERDLRMLKLQQKIGGCFRTTKGANTFCRIRSYLSSARKQGRGLLTAVELALKGKPVALIS